MHFLLVDVELDDSMASNEGCSSPSSFQIIKRAKELGEDPIQLSDRFCREFNIDMEALQCLPPTVEPRVSDHVDDIIHMIKQVVQPCW